MKKLITTLTSVFIAVLVMAQVPNVMNYQAVARNNAGQALANQSIKVRLSVVKNTVTQYSETRQVTTNALGLFNVQIGSSGALSTTGNFSTINWQSNAAPGYALKVELDINNSGLFTDMGSQALVSVPYAFAAKRADQATETVNIAGRPLDQGAIPTIGSRLGWDGTEWTPLKKDSVAAFHSLSGINIPAGGASPSWVFPHNSANMPTFTISQTTRVVLNAGVALTNSSNGTITASVAICYQSTVPGSPIQEFVQQPRFFYVLPDATLPTTYVHSSGVVTLPPGEYRISLGIRNYANTINLGTPGYVTGTIEFKY